MALFSRAYTMSNLSLAKYAISSLSRSNALLPKYLLGQMKNGDAAVSRDAIKSFAGASIGVLFKDMALMFATLQIANYIMTASNDLPDKNGKRGGHFSWDNEHGKKFHIAIGEKPSGQVVYMGNPFRAARDIFGMTFMGGVDKWREVWNNKLNPSVSTLFHFLNNTDWRGKTIINSDSEWYKQVGSGLKYWTEGLTGISSLGSTFNPDSDSWRNYYRIFGAQISHGARGGPVVGEKFSIKRSQRIRMDKVMNEATDLYRRGHKAKSVALLHRNNFSKITIRNFLRRNGSPREYYNKRISAHSLMRHANKEERKRIEALMP